MDLSLALGERVAAGRVRVNPRELLLKMSKLQAPRSYRVVRTVTGPRAMANSLDTTGSSLYNHNTPSRTSESKLNFPKDPK